MPENTETTDVHTVEDVGDSHLSESPTPAPEDQSSDPTPEVDAEHQGDADGENNGKGDLPEDQEEDGPGREAKKYRLKLRSVEAERDELVARVEALQRDTVEKHVEAAQMKPAALWAAGTQLPDLLTDTGTVDPDKVNTAIRTARESLGLPDRRKNIVPQEGRVPQPPRTPSGIAGMVQTVMGNTEQ